MHTPPGYAGSGSNAICPEKRGSAPPAPWPDDAGPGARVTAGRSRRVDQPTIGRRAGAPRAVPDRTDRLGAIRVLFRAAAGPRIGFGHLIRARSLARALGTTARVSIRGTEATCRIAARYGFVLQPSGIGALDGRTRPDVLVVDDPSGMEGAIWVDAARSRGIAVVTVADRGIGCVDGDIVVDGSLEPLAGACVLGGPLFAVLDPTVAMARELAPIERGGVLIALGGGTHVHTWGTALAGAICERIPNAQVRIVGGFARVAQPASGPVRWVSAPDGLVRELRRAAVAVVAGGLTLYEAAALGVPTVGLAVVPAQQRAIAAFAWRGAALNAGLASRRGATARAADAVFSLLSHRQRASRMASAAARLVDGRGVFRVADAIRDLAARHEDRRHAA